MPNDDFLLSFLEKREARIGRLLRKASELKTAKFDDVKEELKSHIEGSEVYFYGTKMMGLGHEKSHLNIFLEVGELPASFVRADKKFLCFRQFLSNDTKP